MVGYGNAAPQGVQKYLIPYPTKKYNFTCGYSEKKVKTQ
jgi:hypothetical protein